jgi:hypothetical protein
MNNRKSDSHSSVSFGEMPSASIRQLDHAAWWESFMSLVGTMPQNAEALRLSDDPIHIVHGQYFSIRECAARAIDAAENENRADLSAEYKEQAKRLIASYDKRVYIRVGRYYDRQKMKYLIVGTLCMVLGAVMGFLYAGLPNKSTGLIVLIGVSLFVAAISGILALLADLRKKRILYRGHPAHGGHSDKEEHNE